MNAFRLIGTFSWRICLEWDCEMLHSRAIVSKGFVMKSFFVFLVLAAGVASPVAASTFLDFTSSSINAQRGLTGVVEGVGYTISAGGGKLTNARHKNNNGCSAARVFACSEFKNALGETKYDVGFGVDNGNNGNGVIRNEIDGVTVDEYVQVAFSGLVNITGFAGMLTYIDSVDPNNTEQAELLYSTDGSTWASLLGITQYTDADFGGKNDTFGTVGLSYRDGFSVVAKFVRFQAKGTGTFDNNNANITAAGLEVAPVPVPAALPLLLAGLGAFGWVARRNTRKAA